MFDAVIFTTDEFGETPFTEDAESAALGGAAVDECIWEEADF